MTFVLKQQSVNVPVSKVQLQENQYSIKKSIGLSANLHVTSVRVDENSFIPIIGSEV